MVAVLVEIAEVSDIQYLATQQFKAKSSELAGMSCTNLINGAFTSLLAANCCLSGWLSGGVVILYCTSTVTATFLYLNSSQNSTHQTHKRISPSPPA
jgi:hypothetical protein